MTQRFKLYLEVPYILSVAFVHSQEEEYPNICTFEVRDHASHNFANDFDDAG